MLAVIIPLPEFGAGAPSHPIVMPPPGVWPPQSPGAPSHPIGMPPVGVWPSPPPVGVWPPPSGGAPSHPIVLPPEGAPGSPSHPIAPVPNPVPGQLPIYIVAPGHGVVGPIYLPAPPPEAAAPKPAGKV